VNRLIFVRHLYNIGVGQLTSQFPAASVLSFHDATESFLQLGIEHHDVKTGRHTEFIELFDELNKHLSGLELRDWLKRLNDTRIAVKHKALDVSAEEARKCRSRTQVFFEVNCPKILNVEFFSFSMSESITDETIQSCEKPWTTFSMSFRAESLALGMPIPEKKSCVRSNVSNAFAANSTHLCNRPLDNSFSICLP
jgi:hypothetical protein